VNSIRAGDDIKTLQENMGHYSAAFTLDRYGHVTETMRRESAHRMEHFLDSL
jgi:integrase